MVVAKFRDGKGGQMFPIGYITANLSPLPSQVNEIALVEEYQSFREDKRRLEDSRF
jgi:hypothetical protein